MQDTKDLRNQPPVQNTQTDDKKKQDEQGQQVPKKEVHGEQKEQDHQKTGTQTGTR